MSRPIRERDDATRHRLLLELGRGGMGTVYLALARGPAGFAKLKVVKRLRPDLASDPQFLGMFLDEARLSARLNHPNIVQTNEVGFDGDDYFLEMEYLEGQSLDAIGRAAAPRGGVPLPFSLWILTQVLAGLHYAHELRDLDGTPLKIVHRDVSPHNVFVTYDGAVKVLDFGIAKAATSLVETRTGAVKGKATFMAPEQAARRPVDRRADVFPVGVMLWEALTRQRLWSGLSDVEIFLRLEKGELSPPSKVAADVSPSLEAICMKALAPKPDDRYATAAEMQDALEAALATSGERAGARQVGAFVSELFAERRAAIEAAIEAEMRSADAPSRSAVEVPRVPSTPSMRSAGTERGTVSTISGANQVATKAENGAASGAAARRGRRSWLAVSLAAIALAVVVGFGLRARLRTSAAVVPSAPPRACNANADCARAHPDEAWICRQKDGACVAVEQNGCKLAADPGTVANDRALWLGVMLDTRDPEGREESEAALRALELARRDFMTISGGVPVRGHDDVVRPIGLVECSDDDPEGAARHLAADLRVPAIIGFPDSQRAIDLGRRVLLPNDVLEIAAVNKAAMVTELSQRSGAARLVWRTTVNNTQAAAPIGALVSDVLEPRLRASGILAKGEPMRVAFVRLSTTAGVAFDAAVLASLRFNGKSVAENGDHFQEFVLGEPGTPRAADDLSRAVAGIVHFKPHVVIHFGDEVVPPLEAAWPRGAAPRPLYVTNGPHHGAFLPAIGRDAATRRRVFAVSPLTKTTARLKLLAHYNESFSQHVTLEDASIAETYDAFYLVAYALYALGDEAPSGASLGRAIARLLPPGRPIDVGPASILDAFRTLRAGEKVDLNGAQTSLDLDPATGESQVDFSVLCVGVDAVSGEPSNVESGLVYRSRTGALEGTLGCP